MTTHRDSDRDDSIERLQTATEDLADPIEELTAQLSSMTDRMSRVADEFETLNRSHEPSATATADSTGHAVADD